MSDDDAVKKHAEWPAAEAVRGYWACIQSGEWTWTDGNGWGIGTKAAQHKGNEDANESGTLGLVQDAGA